MNIFDEMIAIKESFNAVIDKLHNHEEADMSINIIIDDTDAQNPIFVEIENDKGQSISIGEELRTEEGYRKLRISTYSIISNDKI
jgi:biotin synthase-related radical SAM superfamily protein